MSKFLILHGSNGSPQSNWFMWLKGKLIGQGHEVWLPQLPNADKPNAETYTAFLLGNKDFIFDEDTVLIGHSSGAVEILNLLQSLPKNTVVKAAFLVGAFKDSLGEDTLEGMFTKPFDFEAIRSHCQKFTFLHSDDDPHCPIDQAEYLALKTSGEIIVFEGQGHFSTEASPHYKQFPELLDFITELD